MSFRLFISHSSPTRESKDRLIALGKAIEAKAKVVKVLYDLEQIVPGDEWRRRISYLLHACDSAVVLLDEEALKSDWVLAEAMFLSIRQAHNQGFRFVPVSFLTKDQLADLRAAMTVERVRLGQSSWAPVQLGDLQYVLASDVDEVAEQVIGALNRTGALGDGDNLVEVLARQLAPHLSDAGALLEHLAESLGTDVPYRAEDAQTRVALVLARQMISDASLVEVGAKLARFGQTFGRKHGRDILDILVPLQYDVEAAMLMVCSNPIGGYIHTLLQSNNPSYTVPRYIRRAYLPNREKPVIALTGRLATMESLRDELRVEFRKRLRSQANGVARKPNTAELEALLRKKRMYVCLPAIDSEVLQQLADAYPQASFVLHHDSNTVVPTPSGVIRVLPALEPSREEDIWIEYVNLCDEMQGNL